MLPYVVPLAESMERGVVLYLRRNLCHSEKERDSAVSLSVLGKCSNNKERDSAVALSLLVYCSSEQERCSAVSLSLFEQM